MQTIIDLSLFDRTAMVALIDVIEGQMDRQSAADGETDPALHVLHRRIDDEIVRRVCAPARAANGD